MEKSRDTKRRLFVGLLLIFIASVAFMGVMWVKSLPKLTLVEGKLTVLNCELPLPTYSIGVCPKLHCKKLILESGQFPHYIKIGFSNPKPSAEQVLTGAIRYREEGTEKITYKPFECELDGYLAKAVKFP